MSNPNRFVYVFGSSRTEGAAAMKNLLGGKGANLAEMCRLGISVPSGFTISTEACTEYTQHGQARLSELIEKQVREGIAFIESEMDKRFGNHADPLLLSVRSGARASMPGMMDTILNLGLNDDAVAGLARKASRTQSHSVRERFVGSMRRELLDHVVVETFPDHSTHRYLVLDNDAIFSAEVACTVASQLLDHPPSQGMAGDVEVEDTPSPVVEDEPGRRAA